MPPKIEAVTPVTMINAAPKDAPADTPKVYEEAKDYLRVIASPCHLLLSLRPRDRPSRHAVTVHSR